MVKTGGAALPAVDLPGLARSPPTSDKDMLMIWLWLAIGLVILTAGAEVLVRGAVGLATAMKVSPLVIGLTVVAFGTSAPELFVSLRSGLAGQPEIALGNVIGSNVFNVLVILGLSALIVPLRVDQQLVRLDVPLMIGISILVYLMALDGRIGRADGAVLAGGLVAYTVWSIRKSRQENDPAVLAEYAEEFPPAKTGGLAMVIQVVLVVVGLTLLVTGSGLFVDSAVMLARRWGLSELVIGLTLVAAGTSLPEVATSLMAAFKGERDIAVGNVVGSNLFNLMCVLGLTGLTVPGGIPVDAEAIQQDLPVMVFVALACLPVFLIGYSIERWEGLVLLAFYALYTAALICEAQGLDPALGTIYSLAWVIGPLAVAGYVWSLVTARGREA
jgi:cation:H+ antiporter